METNTVHIKLTRKQKKAVEELLETAYQSAADGNMGAVFCQIYDDTAVCKFIPAPDAWDIVKITNPEWYASQKLHSKMPGASGRGLGILPEASEMGAGER